MKKLFFLLCIMLMYAGLQMVGKSLRLTSGSNIRSVTTSQLNQTIKSQLNTGHFKLSVGLLEKNLPARIQDYFSSVFKGHQSKSFRPASYKFDLFLSVHDNLDSAQFRSLNEALAINGIDRKLHILQKRQPHVNKTETFSINAPKHKPNFDRVIRQLTYLKKANWSQSEAISDTLKSLSFGAVVLLIAGFLLGFINTATSHPSDQKIHRQAEPSSDPFNSINYVTDLDYLRLLVLEKVYVLNRSGNQKYLQIFRDLLKNSKVNTAALLLGCDQHTTNKLCENLTIMDLQNLGIIIESSSSLEKLAKLRVPQLNHFYLKIASEEFIGSTIDFNSSVTWFNYLCAKDQVSILSELEMTYLAPFVQSLSKFRYDLLLVYASKEQKDLLMRANKTQVKNEIDADAFLKAGQEIWKSHKSRNRETTTELLGRDHFSSKDLKRSWLSRLTHTVTRIDKLSPYVTSLSEVIEKDTNKCKSLLEQFTELEIAVLSLEMPDKIFTQIKELVPSDRYEAVCRIKSFMANKSDVARYQKISKKMNHQVNLMLTRLAEVESVQENEPIQSYFVS